ncbi:MAG: type II secretion system protein GspN [Zetaproteobacteria bacterium]|nr:type II secretion system protein GspN [Zetaproteobacteria bacterium]
MKKLSNSLIYLLVGVLSFFFFLYLSFPYNLLKESLTLRLNQNSEYRVKLGELSPHLPLGVQVDDLSFSMYGKAMELKHVELELSLLSLLAGNVKVNFHVDDVEKGYLSGTVIYSMGALLSGTTDELIPKHLYIDAKNFIFGNIVDFILNAQANSPNVNMLLKPWLESIDINGKLNLLVDMDISPKDLRNSTGKLELNIDRMSLKSLNESLSIPEQIFSRFRVKAKLTTGMLVFDKSSGLQSQDLSLSVQGKITQKPQILKSQLDILAALELGEPLQKEFGFIIDTFLQVESNGKLNIQVRGPLTPKPTLEFL